jgi:hypothetical protein
MHSLAHPPPSPEPAGAMQHALAALKPTGHWLLLLGSVHAVPIRSFPYKNGQGAATGNSLFQPICFSCCLPKSGAFTRYKGRRQCAHTPTASTTKAMKGKHIARRKTGRGLRGKPPPQAAKNPAPSPARPPSPPPSAAASKRAMFGSHRLGTSSTKAQRHDHNHKQVQTGIALSLSTAHRP